MVPSLSVNTQDPTEAAEHKDQLSSSPRTVPCGAELGSRTASTLAVEGLNSAKMTVNTGSGRIESHRQIQVVDVLKIETEEMPTCLPFQTLPVSSSGLDISTFLLLLPTPVKVKTKERSGQESPRTREWGRK